MGKLEKLHSTFRNEITTACQAFYAWKDIHNIASKDKNIHRGLNENALTWNLITHSLQNTFFITLGRIFDIDGEAFSIHILLRSCMENLDQFSKDALRERKTRDSKTGEQPWLNEYIESSYQPYKKDFQKLRGEISKKQRQYEAIYRPIRNKVIAHKEFESMECVDKLFGKTNIGDIQELLKFLHQIECIIFDLLYNGKLSKIGDHKFNEVEILVEDDISKLLSKLKA